MESIEDVLNLDENNKLKLNKVLIKINNLNSIEFNKWLNKITKTLKKYVKELNLNNIEIYETGRLGIVFSAHSSLGNLVVKVILI